MRFTSCTSASSRNRLSFKMSGRQSASGTIEGAACLTILRSGGWMPVIAGRRMVIRSARGRDGPACPADRRRLETDRDQVGELPVAAAGLRPSPLVKDRHAAIDRLGYPDPFARDRRRDRSAKTLLDLVQTDSGLARHAIRDEDRAIVLEEKTCRAHDAPEVAKSRELGRRHEDHPIGHAKGREGKVLQARPTVEPDAL